MNGRSHVQLQGQTGLSLCNKDGRQWMWKEKKKAKEKNRYQYFGKTPSLGIAEKIEQQISLDTEKLVEM